VDLIVTDLAVIGVHGQRGTTKDDLFLRRSLPAGPWRRCKPSPGLGL